MAFCLRLEARCLFCVGVKLKARRQEAGKVVEALTTYKSPSACAGGYFDIIQNGKELI